jgi:hypothetical protein
MSSNPKRSEHLFIVRIWQEPEQTRAGEWRGSIEHVPSGQRLYFVSFNDLSDFIRLRMMGASHDVDEVDSLM